MYHHIAKHICPFLYLAVWKQLWIQCDCSIFDQLDPITKKTFEFHDDAFSLTSKFVEPSETWTVAFKMNCYIPWQVIWTGRASKYFEQFANHPHGCQTGHPASLGQRQFGNEFPTF